MLVGSHLLRASVVLLLLISPATAQCVDPVTDVTCTAFEGKSYPITVSWTNNDPDDEYTEFDILRDGEVIATITDPDAEEYTDSSGPGGQLVFTVEVRSDLNDCSVESEEICYVAVGRLYLCASNLGDFEAVEFAGGDSKESTVTTLDEDCLADVKAIDGWDDSDLSPTEDGRVDIADLMLALEFSAESVESFTWELTSPEGTTLIVWDEDGGGTEWGVGDAVMFSDLGIEIPDLVPSTCDVDRCYYKPSGAGSFADFVGEDANGEWALEGSTSGDGTLHDWCVVIFPDEFNGYGLRYLRGDVNGDGVVTALRDAIHLLQHYFGDAHEPPCLMAADVDGSGLVSVIIDALRLLQWAFGEADPPASPFPDCGVPGYGYYYEGFEPDPCEVPGDCTCFE